MHLVEMGFVDSGGGGTARAERFHPTPHR
ncbi:MAG: hypothetical protein QOH39_212, partial [Verrucomicrobiota bacterium]